MSDSRARLYRRRMAAAQQHRCYYCQFPMWLANPERFAASFGITRRAAKRFRCTAEHLRAQCEGGISCAGNIVAACEFCNRNRHHRRKNLTPESYMALVRRRIARHGWHPIELHRLLRLSLPA